MGLFLAIALLAAITWLTRHPDTIIVQHAQEWPLIGPVARAFSRAYASAQVVERESSTADPLDGRRVEVDGIETEPEAIGATPYTWVEPGRAIYSEPNSDSTPLLVTTALSNLPVLQQSEEWLQVAQPRLGESPIVGWIRVDAAAQPTYVSTPEPVLPLAALPIDPLRLERAMDLMIGPIDERDCGPYRLVTDASELDWIEGCSRLALELEITFESRYGLRPVSPAAETILLFRSAERYRAFRDEEGVPFESQVAHSYPSRGYVAILQADRSAENLVSSLIHELTHLLTRRSIGPALPAWLSEGLADDLGQSAVDGFHRLSPGKLGGETRQLETRILRSGAVASLAKLQTLDQLQTLPRFSELVRVGEEEFYDPQNVQLYYALSSFWIRYLLNEPEGDLARGFRSYLRAIAAGAPITPSLLIDALGTDPVDLETGFREWLRGLEVA